MQEVTAKYKSFKSTVRSLNAFMNDLPSNKMLSEDTMTQINTKQNSQKVSLVKMLSIACWDLALNVNWLFDFFAFLCSGPLKN